MVEDKRFEGLDRLIHEPARLAILSTLYVVESADFLFIMKQTGLSFGNLSSHMSKLEQIGYIEVIKDFVERRPHTMLKITEEGRVAFNGYKHNISKLLEIR